MRLSLRFVLLQVGVCALLIGSGYWAGRRTVLLPLERHVAGFRTGDTLGRFVDPALRDAMAQAYLDPAEAKRDLDAYVWNVPSVMTPFVGNGPRPGVSGNARVNYWQCRGKEQIVLPKPTGSLRILMTGGSTMFGSGAPADDRTIAAYLRKTLAQEPKLAGRHVEVFALAMPGWTTTHERIVIENRLLDLAPDLVVSFSGANDVVWASMDLNVLWLRTHADQFWFELVNQVFELCGEPKMLDMSWPEPSRPTPELVAERLLRNVRLGALALAQEHVPYLFALQPTLELTKKSPSARERQGLGAKKDPAYVVACAERIRRALQTLTVDGFRFADLTSVFDLLKESDELFLDTVHFGDRGNQIIAKALAAAVLPVLIKQ